MTPGNDLPAISCTILAASSQVPGKRHAADVGRDAAEALLLDDRADVVQHDRPDRRGCTAAITMAMRPPRDGADDRGRHARPASGNEIEHVLHFDRDGVVAEIGIGLREAAPAIVERVDVARCLRVL